MRLPRPPPRAVALYQKWLPLVILLLSLASLTVPLPPALGASTSYATGTVNLNLYDANMTPVSVGGFLGIGASQVANVSGIISLTGDYQYVSSVTNTVNSTVKTPGGSSTGRAGNVTVTVGVGATSGTTVLNYTSVSENAAPIYLSGTVTLYYKASNGSASQTQDIAFSGFAYYVDESVAFYNVFDNVNYKDAYYALVTVTAKSANGSILAQDTWTVSNPYYSTVHNMWFAQNIWIGVLALPVFNDTMLGAWVHPGVFSPTVPIGALYNIMAIVGFIVLAFSVVFGFIPVGRRDRDRGYGLGPQLANIAIGVGIILIFPYVYDHVAILLNYLNAYLIAYPASYTTFLTRLWEIQVNIFFPPQWNFFSLIFTTLFLVVYTVVWAIMWVMIYLLGTVRILLIAAMLVMFPLSVALRDIPFTSKLGRMIEDTLFGLMLATILSSGMLAVASGLLTNWNAPGNIFVMGGFQPQWVAIAAVLGALLAPTVLAPLTSTLFETTSEVAMLGGAVGANVVFGGLGGGLG
ncbi:MAG: hypothetical protein ACPL2E_08000, partial [Conexivisphaera sp.]